MAILNQFDISKIKEAIEVMIPQEDIYEIRVIGENKKGYKATYSGYFQGVENINEKLFYMDLDRSNVFITLNKLDSACYSRIQRNHLMLVKDEPTTSDDCITEYRWLLIDLDPKRISGVSSTNEELCRANDKSKEVKSYMSSLGFSDPIVACSGNGMHLLYRICLEYQKDIREDNKQLIEQCLKVLDALFSDEYIKVDTSVYNPARISKLYGTRASKGANTSERPHRMSQIISTPAEIMVNPIQLLIKLSDEFNFEDD